MLFDIEIGNYLFDNILKIFFEVLGDKFCEFVKCNLKILVIIAVMFDGIGFSKFVKMYF